MRPNDRQFLALARYRLGRLIPYLPERSGYDKRVRRLGAQIARAIAPSSRIIAVRCGQPAAAGLHPESRAASRARPRAAANWPAAPAALLHGDCAATADTAGAFRLYLLCAPDGLPVRFELFPADLGERDGAREMLEGTDLDGYTVLADKGFAGEDFEAFMADLDATPASRPPRRAGTATAPSARSANGSSPSSGRARASFTLERHRRTHP